MFENPGWPRPPCPHTADAHAPEYEADTLTLDHEPVKTVKIAKTNQNVMLFSLLSVNEGLVMITANAR